jgi:DNA polymerase-3 subunit gamma/tau
VATAAPAERSGLPEPPGLIDEKARRLADFFNGEVLPLEDPLPGLSDSGDEAAA